MIIIFKSVKVDTIHLVTKITKRQFESLKSLFVFSHYSKHFEAISTHITNNDKVHYALKYNVKDELGRPNITTIMRNSYNLKLELQSNCIMNMPDKIRRLLQQFDWKVSQIELAFDFVTPASNHFSLIEENTAVTYKYKDKKSGKTVDFGQNYYIYADSSPQQALIYDKKKQLQDKKGIEIDDKYLLRYEITVKPMLKEQRPIHELQFGWIDQYLKKFVFIPDMRAKDKRLFDDLLKKVMRRRAKHLKNLSDKQRKKIREVAEQNKFDFVGAFHENISNLFGWIPTRIEAKAK